MLRCQDGKQPEAGDPDAQHLNVALVRTQRALVRKNEALMAASSLAAHENVLHSVWIHIRDRIMPIGKTKVKVMVGQSLERTKSPQSLLYLFAAPHPIEFPSNTDIPGCH